MNDLEKLDFIEAWWEKFDRRKTDFFPPIWFFGVRRTVENNREVSFLNKKRIDFVVDKIKATNYHG